MQFQMKKTIFIYGGLCVIILLLFQLEKWSLFALGIKENTYLVFAGVIFLVLGILASRYFLIRGERKARKRKKSILSKQEHEVLILIADGLSNKEIAKKLFIAESTVKSHVSSILGKLGARRRTEAIKIGKHFEII